MTLRSGHHGRNSPRAVLVALLIGLVVASSLAALPGCSCTQDAAAKKKAEEEAAKKKKKKEAEKPKENFEPLLVRSLPSNDPTQNNKNPELRIKPGHWTALSGTTRANNFDFVGELETFAHGVQMVPLEIENTSSRLAVWRPASLPKGQTKAFEMLLFVPKRPAQAGRVYSLQSALRGARGGGIAISGDRPGESLDEHQHLIVVLATNPAAYSSLDKLYSVSLPPSIENDAGHRYYHVLTPNAERRVPLPSHPLAWTTVAFLFWDDINPAVLTAEQQQSLLDWLHWGGQIVVSGPGSLDKLKGTYLAPYLPAETAQTVKLEQAAFDELNANFSLPAKSKRVRTIQVIAERPMVGVEFKKHADAIDVEGTGGLVVERRVGGGRIVVTAFPLTDVRIKQWKNFDGFLNSVLLRRPARKFDADMYGSLIFEWDAKDAKGNKPLRTMLREARLGSTLRYFTRDIGFPEGEARPDYAYRTSQPEIEETELARIQRMAQFGGSEPDRTIPDTSGLHPDLDDWHFLGYHASPQSGVASWSDYGAASSAARAALAEAAGIEIPRAEFVLKVLAVYLVVLVPLNWLIFWVLGRVEWAWVAAPIIAIIGAVGVIRLAQLDIGFARSRTEIAVLEAQAGYDRAHLTRYTALYTSLSSEYRLNFADNSAVALPLASPPGIGGPQKIASIMDVQLRQDKETSLAGVQVQSNSTSMVHSEQMYPLGGKLTLVGDAQQGWTVKNTSNITLQDVGILRKTAAGAIETAYLAKLSPQTSAPLAFSPLPEKLAPWLPEWNRSTVFAPDQAAAEEAPSETKGQVRLTGLVKLATDRLRLCPGDVRLVAWTSEPLSGLAIAPQAPQNKTYTLVLAHLARAPLPAVRTDTNVADDFFQPPLEPASDGTEPPPVEAEATTGN
ncbi:MAG: hypothetical protein SFU86_02550 [Pirellulaceae bacterium]|nr:hypothetical protein [Pirellulaceae bacterium]